MKTDPIITAEEFEAKYAADSGLTIDKLREHRTVRRCVCEDEICLGWAMLPIDFVLEMEAEHPWLLHDTVPGSVIEGRP